MFGKARSAILALTASLSLVVIFFKMRHISVEIGMDMTGIYGHSWSFTDICGRAAPACLLLKIKA
ncbi:MAG: hypothetical protein QGH73_16465 [Rhodospirillales bacterium]|jgi:hypothetical protein|nr:hypothetical protein [Rhodospirillaceae bacterium]MDP6646291.1 hypothetical protein [Rhodospirillales bacterium]MDP6843265.1 hypothetical protein [Rhodospirillales bacterium]|tara:strand:+ start:594 stop:788 length:195 start_codon:yes stop_codon:yes gene_type:complete